MNSYQTIKSESPYYQEVVLYYKTNPCIGSSSQKPLKGKPLNTNCAQSPCFQYHDLNERRRPVFDETTHGLLYQPVKCPYFGENGYCSQDDACKYSHTQNEISYHPLFYKTEPCMDCQFSKTPKLCPGYHSDETSRSTALTCALTLNFKKVKDNSPNQTSGYSNHKTFSLDTFKIKPCMLKGNHNPKVCNFYHNQQDRRRSTNFFTYSADMCKYVLNHNNCPQGDNCGCSHNKLEQLYHPSKYKMKFCLQYPHNAHKCEYNSFCSFAHNEDEIKIDLLHNLKKDKKFYIEKYKTVFCPYIYEHDRISCIYAHNPQDFRRDITKFNYNPVKCPKWAHKPVYTYEEGKCPEQMNCKKLSWVERA